MPRIYKVTFENVLVAAAQDLVQITGAAGKMIRILRRCVGLADSSLPAGQMLALRERFLPSAVTVGAGGTTGITPSKTDPGDAAASSATCATNNTTKATTGGTATILMETGVHIYNGLDEPVLNPYPIGPSEAYVFELLSTVSGTVHLSGYVELEETGG